MQRLNYIFSVLFVLAAFPVLAQEKNPDHAYRHGPDSVQQKNVPKGTVKTYEWLSSNVYPETKRRFYTYVPAQYDPKKPAALMVFLDGHAYVSKTGSFRVPIVFDNLIHKKQMPVTIGVFVDPGHKKDKLPEKPGWNPRPENRSIEYDTPNATYSKFLIDEILAEVKKQYNVSEDPKARAICGSSSGGICAFTVAWERPDSFQKVISHIGSFVNIRGGDTYPGKIRRDKKRPLRILLQDGSGDLDNKFGNWPLANQQMYSALKFRDYDVKFVYGKGAHNGKHGGAIFPNSLRWLWRGFENVDTNLAVIPEVQTAAWAQSWWMKRHEEKLLERKKLNNDVDLLMVGDSITHSWENGGKKVWDQFYAHRKPLNIGFSGDRTENVLWRIQNGAIDGISPKLTVMMIGTNNAGHRDEASHQTAEGIERIVDELKTRLPKSKILLLGIFPRGADANDSKRKLNEGTNAIIQKLADDERIFFLNINNQFLKPDGTLPKSIMPDLLHPNAEGYQIWAEAVEPKIKELLGE